MFLKRAKATKDQPGNAQTQSARVAFPTKFKPRRSYDWNILDDSGDAVYGEPDRTANNVLRHVPRFVLDVGCNTGGRGAALKAEYPDVHVWGIEPNPKAAEMARRRLDRVITGRLEDVDWHLEGVLPDEIDTVLLFDVLEHMYNPWAALLCLRNLVHDEAQLLVSIPNVQNLLLIDDLVNGIWRYKTAGLLDMTHIRFFTWQDMLEMFYQTGFRLKHQLHTIDEGSRAILVQHGDGPFPCQVQMNGWSFQVNSRDQLSNICATQDVAVLQPANYDELTAEEKQLVDGPFPQSRAFGHSRYTSP